MRGNFSCWFRAREDGDKRELSCNLCGQSFAAGLGLEDAELSKTLLHHLAEFHKVASESLPNITQDHLSTNKRGPTECSEKGPAAAHRKGTRVWSDGCYDMVHFGHANQLRQTKAMGDYLVVGIHSDEEIMKNKGPPVFTQEERYKIVKAIKWVDEVVKDAPYVTSLDTLEKYNCDFCVHGSDITCDAEGLDTYRFVKAAGKYKECQRTIGVSTTDLVDRMLEATLVNNSASQAAAAAATSSQTKQCPNVDLSSDFMPSTRKIVQFAQSTGQGPKPGDRVVYAPGAFDIFHVAHVDFLEQVSKLADYVIVGLFSDQTISQLRGPNFPIMNLQERILSVLACKYVHEVVIEAPYQVTEELINHFNIDIVCHGKTAVECKPQEPATDPYLFAKKLGKYVEVDSGNPLTTDMVVERIINKRNDFINRNIVKDSTKSKLFKLLDEGNLQSG